MRLLAICCWLWAYDGAVVRGEDDHPRPLSTIALTGEKEPGATPPRVQWMGFSPDGRHLAVGKPLPPKTNGVRDNFLEVFETATWKSVATVKVQDGCGRLGDPVQGTCAFSSRGEWIAAGTRLELRFVAIPPQKPVLPGGGQLDLPRMVRGPGANLWTDPSGESVFVANSFPGCYRLCRLSLKGEPGEGPRAETVIEQPFSGADVDGFAMNPGAGRFAVALDSAGDGKPAIECWTLANKPARTTIPLPRRAASLALAPDGKTVAAGYGDGSVAWYDTASGKQIRRLPPIARFTVGSVIFHPDGRHLACGTFDMARPNLFLIDLTSGALLTSISADPKGVATVCFSPSGDRVVAAGVSGSVTVWDATRLLKLQRD
ncbi:MAG: hypothetical protein JWO38_2312 [Gemmataceae bacterium]|nr:hypothetical protein [Gemmataceae bacterium]